MGFFKLFNDAAETVKESVEQRKRELQEKYDQRRSELQEKYNQRKSELQEKHDQRRSTPEPDAETKTEYGIIKNGTLEINEGITELKEGSLAKYKSLKKVVFPSSLTSLETHVFENNRMLEELDFSKVTKLNYLPDAFVFGTSKISELTIPYGVKHVGSAVVCDVDRMHPLEVNVPATVHKFEPFDGGHAVTFRLFTSNLDIEWLIDDAKQFYVLEKDLSTYEKQMQEYGGDVPIGFMTDRFAAFYSELIVGPDRGNEKEEEKTEAQESPSNSSNKADTQTAIEDSITFSPRVEALIKSAFRDGVITKKEREIIIKRAVAEGEDADEFEMLLDSRIAEAGIKEE